MTTTQPTDTGSEKAEPAKRRNRLSAERNVSPWVAAPQDRAGCFFFWLPVTGFPLMLHEKKWLEDFMARFELALQRSRGLRGEIFLEHGLLSQGLRPTLVRHLEAQPRSLGLGRSSDNDPAAALSEERLNEVVKDNRPVAQEDLSGRMLLWFPRKQAKLQRELFLGDGCMLTIFLPQDPKTVPPKMHFTPALRASHPAFQRMDVDAMVEGTFALQDSFLPRSKKLLGKGLEVRPEFSAIQFILPCLEAENIFAASEELRGRWFQLLEVYVRESRKDKGVLLAFQSEDYLAVLAGVVDAMRAEGLTFEQRRGR